jgi:hypothetical protein
MKTKLFSIILLTLFFTTNSCRKNKELSDEVKTSELNSHYAKVNAWLKIYQVGEQIKSNTELACKTVTNKNQITTRLQVGTMGSSIYLITEKNRFNVYGINSKLTGSQQSGIVEIFDFQRKQKKRATI